jgi:hypothetical protein
MTNDEDCRERARQRLAAAELADVLGVPVAAVDASTGPRRAGWLAAALVLAGVFVAGGVAWLRADDAASAVQEPRRFDPVYPWYEREFPWDRHTTHVRDAAAVAALPADATALSCYPSNVEVLDAVLVRPGVRILMLLDPLRRQGGASTDRWLPTGTWRRLAAMPDLEVLILAGGALVGVEDLRELRAAPKLRSLLVGGKEQGLRLDAELASTLVELPKLSTLMLWQCELTADGVAALSGLPHLDTLLLSAVDLDLETSAALARLRGLRMLLLERKPRAVAQSAAQMRHLASLPRLQVLDLSLQRIDDDTLRALPTQLEALALPSLEGVTPEGLRSLLSLRRLRSLTFRGLTLGELGAAKAELVEKLPLEQYGVLAGTIEPEVWRALQASTTLRGLSIRLPKELRSVVEQCARLRRLERLSLLGTQDAAPEDLAALRALPHLRRVDLVADNIPAPVAMDDERLEALRTCLGPNVEVVVR